MTLHDQTHLDHITLTVHRAGTASAQLVVVRSLYAAIYAEPPYCEGADEVAEFTSSWTRRSSLPNFRLIVATQDEKPVGFAFGHQLDPGTRWWEGTQGVIPADLTAERPGRTFAVIELAVALSHRRRGIGCELHTHLLAGSCEERATLLVRPDAPTAQRAYRAWGYRRVGSIQPFPEAPIYDAMVKPLVADRSQPNQP